MQENNAFRCRFVVVLALNQPPHHSSFIVAQYYLLQLFASLFHRALRGVAFRVSVAPAFELHLSTTPLRPNFIHHLSTFITSILKLQRVGRLIIIASLLQPLHGR
jgi:hypothetical protein